MLSMRAGQPPLRPVESGPLPEYPIDPDARLDSHGFIQWEYRRWLSSDMRFEGDHECKSIWFELLNLSHGETPVGTLPRDLRRLAKMVQPAVDPDRFERLCTLPYGPLYGWVPCQCGDDVRLMHPVVLRVVQQAFSSRANHAARAEAASHSRRLQRLTKEIYLLSPRLGSEPRFVRWIDRHIQEQLVQRGGERRRPEELHAAIQACLDAERLGKLPKPVEK